MSDSDIESNIVNQPGKDGVVIDDDTMEQMFQPVAPEQLPDPSIITSHVVEILEFMCTDDVVQMKSQNNESYKDMMRSKFKTFSDRYPSLFDMVIRGDDITHLMSMLDKIGKVKSGMMSMEEAKDKTADDLAEQYVYSKLSKNEADKLRKKMKNRTSNKKKKKYKG